MGVVVSELTANVSQGVGDGEGCGVWGGRWNSERGLYGDGTASTTLVDWLSLKKIKKTPNRRKALAVYPSTASR